MISITLTWLMITHNVEVHLKFVLSISFKGIVTTAGYDVKPCKSEGAILPQDLC